MKTAEPVRDKKKVKEMLDFYKNKGQFRNYALLLVGFHTALRVSDLLRLRWCDVYDAKRRRVRDTITIIEKKTKKTKSIAMHPSILNAFRLLRTMRQPSDENSFVFENKRTGRAISRVQAYRIVNAAANYADLRGTISCHSLRKSFGYHALKNGVSLAVIMDIYNHSSFSITKRYLGVTQDDKNSAYLCLNFG